jgi:hypothetical protein
MGSGLNVESIRSRGHRVRTRTPSAAPSDFSGAYMCTVRLVAFADRPCSSDQGVLEISRFSCMLFLSARGFSDYAGAIVHSRLEWPPCCLPPTRNEVGILIYGLFAAQSPRPPMPPVYASGLSRCSPNCPSERSRSRGGRYRVYRHQRRNSLEKRMAPGVG